MTQVISDVVGRDPHARYSGAAAALNFIRGAMIGHLSASGTDPATPIDVERLFSAVQLLTQRYDHEAAPFIREWHPAIQAFGRQRFPAFFADRIRRALVRGRC